MAFVRDKTLNSMQNLMQIGREYGHTNFGQTSSENTNKSFINDLLELEKYNDVLNRVCSFTYE